MKQLLYISILFLIFSSCQTTNEIEGDNVKSTVYYLADDDKMGRANGSEEMKEISQWLAEKFSSYKLEPAGEENTYFQNYVISYSDHNLSERNVLGKINGTDPNAGIIVISAHYDHIGIMSGKTDSICNGAEDDASGIATVLAIAKYFHDNSITPDKTIIFACFSGEEIGLKGSTAYTKSDICPFDDIILNINFELLGRSEGYGKNRFYMAGDNYTDLADQINFYNEDKEWKLLDTISYTDMIFFFSDNYSFMRKTKSDSTYIPAHTFVIGNGDRSYIHQPSDEAEFLDYENLASFAEYMAELVAFLSTKEFTIKWKKEFYTDDL